MHLERCSGRAGGTWGVGAAGGPVWVHLAALQMVADPEGHWAGSYGDV